MIEVDGIAAAMLYAEQVAKCEALELENAVLKRVAEAQPEAPLEWSDTLCDGKLVNYKAALAAVEALGENWRLPTRFELESLLDLSRHYPAIDTEKFHDTKSTWYWTGSTCAWNDAAVWVVYFHLGYVSGLHRYGSACVRAVRNLKEKGE